MKIKILAFLMVMVMAACLLTSCFGEPETPPCTSHVDLDKNGKCDTCNAPVQTACTNHVDANGDGKCDNCSVTMAVADALPDVTWTNNIDLLYQMTDNSNSDELSSGCYHYLAGGVGDSDATLNVDASLLQSIKDRNSAAESYANVTVTYLYYENTPEYRWGASSETINRAATSGTSKGRPDIFSNFIYDMMHASLLGAFKNVYSHGYNSDDCGVSVNDGVTTNYFDFAKDGRYDKNYDAEHGNKGYMAEFMQSLSLSEDKMFLVASDYYVDLVRAFFAVPVNIPLMNGKIDVSNVEGSYNYDYDGDGRYTIVDFYELVKDNKWTYEALMGFANKVNVENNTGDPLDDVLGFALGVNSGLGISGMLYTTSITVIEREWSPQTYANGSPVLDENGQQVYAYRYWYPDATSSNAAALGEFCESLSSLFSSKGVSAINLGATAGELGESNAIRIRFAENGVLFGGVICVGSLEDDVYHPDRTAEEFSFGVAPVPLYRGEYDHDNDPDTPKVTDKYLTQIHNLGKVGGIAYASNKFAAASAFLNYVSLNSTDILNDYYDWTLKMGVSSSAGGGEDFELAEAAAQGSIDMLDYIRANVRSSFDKAFEDALAKFNSQSTETEFMANKWHNLIKSAEFKLGREEMNRAYESVIGAKEAALQDLVDSYRAIGGNS